MLEGLGGKQGCLDVSDGLVCTHHGGRHEVGAGTLSGLHEAIGEAIGPALDRGIEHLGGVRVILVRERVLSASSTKPAASTSSRTEAGSIRCSDGASPVLAPAAAA